MMLWELINPSDPYTFRADSVEVAGAVVLFLSYRFGARTIDEEPVMQTPLLTGWDAWLEAHGIDSDWITAHRVEIADALDSLLIGSKDNRVDAEEAMNRMAPEEREAWRNQRQERLRTSLNEIGEIAYRKAKLLRGEK
jgi:hypothetical protein